MRILVVELATVGTWCAWIRLLTVSVRLNIGLILGAVRSLLVKG